MNPTIRRVFFWGGVFVFLVGGIYLILLAQGLVIDIPHFRLVKTGAIVLNFSPSGETGVLLDGKPYPQLNSSFTNNVLIKNLIPGHYSINIEREHYVTWAGEFDVTSGMLAGNQHIVLFPLEPDWKMIASTSGNFWLTKRGPVIEKNKTLTSNGITIRGDTILLSNPNSAVVVSAANGTQFATELDNPKMSLNIQSLFTSLKAQQLNLPGAVPIANLFLHPWNEEKLFVETEKSLYLLDLKKIALTRLYTTTSTITGIAVSDTETFVLDAKGNLTVLNLILNSSASFPLSSSSTISSISTDTGGNYLFFGTKNGALFAYDRANRAAIPVPLSTDELYPSDNGARLIAVTNKKKLAIFYLADYESDITVKKGTVQFVPMSGMLHDFMWLAGAERYGLVMNGNDLFAVELKDGGNTNTALLETNVKKYALQGRDLFAERLDGSVVKLTLDY